MIEKIMGFLSRIPKKNLPQAIEVTSLPDQEAQQLPESHLKKYLDYYSMCHKPGYAVLVTGEWGTGKSFQVNEALETEEKYYVSLFGLQTAEDVYSTVFAAMFPIKAKIKDVAGAVSEAGIEFGIGSINTGGLTSGVVNALIREKVNTDRTLIFDDLERCGLTLTETLGVINRYVEHHGCRVVVIAHDDRLATDFKDSKEKLFGQTLKVEPQIQSAFNKFVEAYKNISAYSFIQSCGEDIIGIFKSSNISSLRILKHVIEDLARLFSSLSEDHKQNEKAMFELARLFTALNIEVRSGNLTQTDLVGRNSTRLRYMMRPRGSGGAIEEPRVVTADSRYANIDLTNQLLTDDTLVNLLINGNFIEQQIRESLDYSPHFMKPTEIEPWRVFMKFDELDECITTEAVVRLKAQFDDRIVTDSGEMLHLFAFRFLFSQTGLVTADFSEVVNECKQYLDDLLSQGRLPPRETEWRWAESLASSYGGYAYWVDDSYREHFREVSSYLISKRIDAMRNRFPQLTQELLTLVATDGSEFVERICHTSRGGNSFAAIDILSSIKPEEFVLEWIKSPPKNWHPIRTGLTGRYSTGLLSRELKSEAPWILEVLDLLEIEHAKAVGMKRVRLDRAIPQDLKPLAEAVLKA